MVEWCLPQDIDLEGVEFKSMASGSHKIQSDFMWVHLSYVTSSFLTCAPTPPALNSEHARKIPSRKLGSCRNWLAKLFLPVPKILFRHLQYHVKYQLAARICCMSALPVETNRGRPTSCCYANLNVYWADDLHCHYWDCQQRPRVKGKEWQNWNRKDFAGAGLIKIFLTLTGLLVPLNVGINRSRFLLC